MSPNRAAIACPGPMPRRAFLKIGALGLGALAGGSQTNLARLLVAEAAAPGADREFSVILLWAAGGPAYLGPAYVPFYYSGDPNSPAFNVGSLSLGQEAAARLHKRNELLKSFDTLRREIDRTRTMAALDEFNRRALELLTSPRTR